MSNLANNFLDISKEYVVPGEKCEKFRKNGHIALRGILSKKEVLAYRAVFQNIMETLHMEKKDLKKRDTYHRAFLQSTNLWEIDEQAKMFVFAKKFAKIAAELLGVEGVRLYHDQALFKEAGGGSTPWHQDQYYWPLETSNTITMWMPFTKAPLESGTVVFADESHKEGPLAQMAISEYSAEYFFNLAIERDFSLTAYDLKPGDATFHYGWTLHKAPGNSLDYTREAMTIIFFEDNTKVAPLQNTKQPIDLARFLPDCKPGDQAASVLNPVLYSKK